MPGFAFAVPVVSGKEELDRKTLEEIAGPRLAEHEAAMRDAGISRHAAWHQQTPDGTLALVYMKRLTKRRLESSQHPMCRSTPGSVK
jgi:hypothetical protein